MYPMVKDIIKADPFFNSEYGFDSGLNSLSLSNEASIGRKKRRAKKKNNIISNKKTIKQKNSFIQKLSKKKKESQMVEENSASIGNFYLYNIVLGNMKRQFIDHNYFGILFNKNPAQKPQSVKRTKGLSEIMNSKNLLSPSKHFELMKSLGNSMGGKHTKMGKSGEMTHHSTNYTPKIRSKDYSG